jgi:hypothetical protein
MLHPTNLKCRECTSSSGGGGGGGGSSSNSSGGGGKFNFVIGV